jgi:cytochrome c biogenesis protein CcmG/thiol:disulfide interchange protein DsbE
MMGVIRMVSLVLILALTAAIAWQTYNNNAAPAEPLPALTLAELDTRAPFDPATIEGTYLLNIWGSWCGPCRIEHAALMALSAEGIAIYGLNWRDEIDDANAFLDELGDPYRGVMRDVEGQSVRALGIDGAPETLVISAEGNILVRWQGPITVDVLNNRIYPALEREARRAR